MHCPTFLDHPPPETQKAFNYKAIHHLSLKRRKRKKNQSMGPPATGQWLHLQNLTVDVGWFKTLIVMSLIGCRSLVSKASALQLRALSLSQSDDRHVALLRPPAADPHVRQYAPSLRNIHSHDPDDGMCCTIIGSLVNALIYYLVHSMSNCQ